MSRTAKTANTTSATKTGSNISKGLNWKERLNPQQYEQLKNTFDLFDQDHSGTIDPEEINKIMEELGDSRKGTLVYNIIQGLKVKSKPITFDEFVELVVPRVGDLKTKEGLRTVFSHLDTDNDDYINYDELKHLAKISGDLINDDQILELLHTIFINHKTNNNQGLYFQEFYTIVTKYYNKQSK